MGLDVTYSSGQTLLNEDEKEGLKIKTITTQQELNEFEQLNIEQAVAWVFTSRFNKTSILTEKFLKKLHQKMYSDVWKWAGTYRKTNKNIGGSWSQIPVALKILLDDTTYWVAHET